MQRQISEKSNSVNDVRGLTWKYQKLEEDHRKACAALKTFMKRTTEDEKEREALNKHLKSQEETIASLKSQLERFTNTSVTSPQIPNDEKVPCIYFIKNIHFKVKPLSSYSKLTPVPRLTLD